MGNVSAWLLRGAAKSTAKAAENGATARVLFSAADLTEPVRTIFANLPNLCYLNALTQALLWIYQARPSARNSEFGDLHALLRPLLEVACFRYHGATASQKGMVKAARDLARPSATA